MVLKSVYNSLWMVSPSRLSKTKQEWVCTESTYSCWLIWTRWWLTFPSLRNHTVHDCLCTMWRHATPTYLNVSKKIKEYLLQISGVHVSVFTTFGGIHFIRWVVVNAYHGVGIDHGNHTFRAASSCHSVTLPFLILNSIRLNLTHLIIYLYFFKL